VPCLLIAFASLQTSPVCVSALPRCCRRRREALVGLLPASGGYDARMPELLLLVILFSLPIAAFAYLLARGRHKDERTRDEGQTTPRSEVPDPGEPAPRRDGRPIPGSRDDRHRHGKP